MNKLSKEKRDQMIAIGVGLVVFVIAILMLLIRPASAKIEVHQAEIEAANEKINNANRLIAQKVAFLEDLEEVKGSLAKIEADMATGNPYLWMNQTLEEFRRRYGDIEISSVGTEQYIAVGIIPDFPYKAVMFGVQGNGFFHDIGTFIADFENAYPFMRIQNLTLEPQRSADAEGSERISFDFQIVALLKPKAAETSE